MMNTTTTIDKATNNQNAFNYAVYMMLGSYFKQMEAVLCPEAVSLLCGE